MLAPQTFPLFHVVSPNRIRYDKRLPAEFSSFRRELERLREQSDDRQTVALFERLLSELEHDRQESRRRLDRFAENLRSFDRRVFTIENSRVFRLLQRATAFLRVWQRPAVVRSRIRTAELERNYQIWVEQEVARMPSRDAVLASALRFTYKPTVSILMHVDNPDRAWLERSIASVKRQSWPDWELCICDDASREPWVGDYLKQQSESDSRIRRVRSVESMGASSSLNRAGILSAGDYVAFLHQHDSLSPDALYQAVAALQSQRHELLYTDEDRIDESGIRRDPLFKPAWSPDLLTASMYLGSFLIVSRMAMERANWLRGGFDGGHLYDLALRLSENKASVHHLPYVLLHTGPAAPSIDAHKRALTDAVERGRSHATVAEGLRPGAFQVRRKISGTPLVSIVICSKTPRLLGTCLRAIEQRTSYPVRELVVLEHRNGNAAAMDRLLANSHCVRVPYCGPFDYATMNNTAVEAANGEIIVLMNDDVEPLSGDWLNELIAHVQRPETAVAGPRLLYPYGAIQHAGIVVGMMDGAGHPNRGCFETAAWPWSATTRNVSAVTGACLAVRRAVFEELGGLDTAFPVNYNDVDFCLRARRAGYEIVYEPAAVLRHYESGTRPRGTTWHERELFYERWGNLIEQGDPYYSPNLTRSREDCSLSLE